MQNTTCYFDSEHRDIWSCIYKYLSLYDISATSCASKYLNNIIDFQKERQKYKLGNKLIPMNSLRHLRKMTNYIFCFLQDNEKINVNHVILEEQIVFIWALLDLHVELNVITKNIQRQIWEGEGYFIPQYNSNNAIIVSCYPNSITLSYETKPSFPLKLNNFIFRLLHVKYITIKSAYEKYDKSGNILVMMSDSILMKETIESVEKKKRKYNCNIRARTFHELCQDNKGANKLVFNLSCPSYTSTELSIIISQVLYYKCKTLEIYTISPGNVISSIIKLFDYTSRSLDIVRLEHYFGIKDSYYGTYKVKKIQNFVSGKP